MDEEPFRAFLDVFSQKPVKVYDHAPPADIREANLVSGIVGRLREDDSIWARREVNLWEMIDVLDDRSNPEDVLNHYEHPIQPDIDILYFRTDGEERTSPLVAVEAKHFSQQTGRGSVLPKIAHSNAGFYAGLGQALALLLMGIDYVFLAHFVYFHPDIWAESGEYKRSELMSAHRTVTEQYATSIHRLIAAFDLPIGYLAAGTRPANDGIAAYPVKRIAPRENPFVDTTIDRRIGSLLEDSFNLL